MLKKCTRKDEQTNKSTKKLLKITNNLWKKGKNVQKNNEKIQILKQKWKY